MWKIILGIFNLIELLFKDWLIYNALVKYMITFTNSFGFYGQLFYPMINYSLVWLILSAVINYCIVRLITALYEQILSHMINYCTVWVIIVFYDQLLHCMSNYCLIWSVIQFNSNAFILQRFRSLRGTHIIFKNTNPSSNPTPLLIPKAEKWHRGHSAR